VAVLVVLGALQGLRQQQLPGRVGSVGSAPSAPHELAASTMVVVQSPHVANGQAQRWQLEHCRGLGCGPGPGPGPGRGAGLQCGRGS
jgi:hypothetical protein